MIGRDNQSPPLSTLLQKMVATGVGALQNRGELFVLELQEEKSRLISLIIRGVGVLFLGMMAVLLLTAVVIFLFPEDRRIYAAAGFALLYLIAAAWMLFRIKDSLKRPPFEQTVAQLKKDRELVESFR